MIRIIQARMLIAKIHDRELYRQLSEFVNDVHKLLSDVDIELTELTEFELDEQSHIQERVRAILGIGPDPDE